MSLTSCRSRTVSKCKGHGRATTRHWPSTRATARATCAYLQTLTKKPVRYVANTHDHFEHTAGGDAGGGGQAPPNPNLRRMSYADVTITYDAQHIR